MRIALAIAVSLLAAAASPLAAQETTYQTLVEEAGSERLLGTVPAPQVDAIARFGPFAVVDARTAALVDVTNAGTPAQFAAMLAAYPGIARLEMIDCPGTDDDRANLRLGRMIHARGIATHVPDGGSVRSGAVELFLAGVRKSAARGAEFAVHSWADDSGMEADDFAADDPVNRQYLDYYREMGMADAEARAFYAMTNSVPNADARWMTAAEMARYVALDGESVDLALALN